MHKQTEEQQTTFLEKKTFIWKHFLYKNMVVNLLRCNFKCFYILLYMNLKPVRHSEFISESPEPQARC